MGHNAPRRSIAPVPIWDGEESINQSNVFAKPYAGEGEATSEPLQGVTAASSGTHTHAGAESRRLAWRCLARPSAGHGRYRKGAAEIPAGISVTPAPQLGIGDIHIYGHQI